MKLSLVVFALLFSVSSLAWDKDHKVIFKCLDEDDVVFKITKVNPQRYHTDYLVFSGYGLQDIFSLAIWGGKRGQVTETSKKFRIKMSPKGDSFREVFQVNKKTGKGHLRVSWRILLVRLSDYHVRLHSCEDLRSALP